MTDPLFNFRSLFEKERNVLVLKFAQVELI